RWWLVDPDGHLFWSTGMDCVGPRAETNLGGLQSAAAWIPQPGSEFAAAAWQRSRHGTGLHVSYLITNWMRAIGTEKWRDSWSTVALAQLRSFGMNTVANWSEWSIAKAAGFPYVRPLNEHFATTPCVFRDFPD